MSRRSEMALFMGLLALAGGESFSPEMREKRVVEMVTVVNVKTGKKEEIPLENVEYFLSKRKKGLWRVQS